MLTPPCGAIYCHENAHIEEDECGAPEFYTGAKLVTLAGDHGRLSAADLSEKLEGLTLGFEHHVQPAAVSLSQATENGTSYRPDDVAAIAEVAQRFDLGLHMDGARFANSVAYLGCTPADITWRAGVDALSFGATKNGGMAAEAAVFFRPELAEAFKYRRKRGGHLFSKMRYVSAQLAAYVADGLWLRYAGRANAMAQRLSEGLSAIPGIEIVYPVEANEVFPRGCRSPSSRGCPTWDSVFIAGVGALRRCCVSSRRSTRPGTTSTGSSLQPSDSLRRLRSSLTEDAEFKPSTCLGPPGAGNGTG